MKHDLSESESAAVAVADETLRPFRLEEGPLRKESSDPEERLHEEEEEAESARFKRLRFLLFFSGVSEPSEDEVSRSAACRDALALGLLLCLNGKSSSLP